MRSSSAVRLFRNPWDETLSTNDLLGFLDIAADEGIGLIEHWYDNGETLNSRKSFGFVILDPTRPRDVSSFSGRLLAEIIIGPDGQRFLPNAKAKADACDRHGMVIDDIKEQNHLLGNDDFAWAGGVNYWGAIGAGSGMTVVQDTELGSLMLATFIDELRETRAKWLTEQRRSGTKKQSWFNPENTPGQDYVETLEITPLGTSGTTS